MFLIFLKSAYRNMVRNWVQSLIQILSLAIGLTVFSMIALFLYDELTVDRSNENLDQIYRIENRHANSNNKGAVSYHMGPVIQENIPEIKHMTRIAHAQDIYLKVMDEFGNAEKVVRLQDRVTGDSGFFNIFPQEFLHGDPHSALKDPYSIILTESLAENLFGSENPVGKILNGSQTVTGVIEDPVNTHLKFEAIRQIDDFFLSRIQRGLSDSLGLWRHQRPTYIMINKNANIKEVEKKIEDTWFSYRTSHDPYFDQEKTDLSLCPLREVHFSDIDPWHSYMSVVDKKILLNFFLLGMVILLLGIINYVNLSTARATRRNREVAIKKVVGSSRFKLIVYFLTESVITTFLSFLIAVTLLQLLFGHFNYLLQSDINLYFLKYPQAWIFIVPAILVIGIISGIYPAIRMSSGSPVPKLAGDSKSGGRGLIIRRVLMLVQFTSAVILMSGILIMHLQIRYMKKQDLGFDAEQIVMIRTNWLTEEQRLLLLSRLDRYPEIEKAGLSLQIPGRYNADNAPVNNPNSIFNGLSVVFNMADLEFFEVYDLKFTLGGDILDQSSLRRINYDTTIETDETYIVINETCRKAIKLDDPVGYQLSDNTYIRGVIEDFHFQSLQYPVKPLLISLMYPGEGHALSMRINSADIQKTLRNVEKEYHEIVYGDNTQGTIPTPVDFYFVEDIFNRQYNQVQRIHDSSGLLSILAMVLACLGLFGLSTFLAQRRTKEIGIRKAMGSSEWQVFVLLAKDFLKWVALSVAIGCPVGWFVMIQWQQQFAYKAPVGIWVYIVVALITFAIALLTVAWQSLKTARANPVDALRDE
ncbi:MAG: FtsX-like permease family protein [Bacteroidetes bacterium]|nr:FtsX-like permease family protein [Bacteroidota bacterium]